MKTYGQYCPIARTSELLAERWTPILLRSLLSGCRTFGELADGAPGISRALLAQRLELLERHGILTKKTAGTGRYRCFYALTEKGGELKAITDAMGAWGARWLELEPHHADSTYVLWATSRLVDLTRIPPRGLIARFVMSDRPRESFWLLLRRPQAEVCSSYPGRDEDVLVTSDSLTISRWHLRDVTYDEATRAGKLRIEGSRAHVHTFLRSLRTSPFAAVERARKPITRRMPR